MARISGKSGSLFFNGQDMSGESNSFTINVENDNFEVTAFSDSAKSFVEGKYGWTVDVEAFYDGADNKWFDQLFDNLGGGAKAMTLAPQGTTGSNYFYTGNAFITSFETETPVDGAVALSASFQGSGTLSRLNT